MFRKLQRSKNALNDAEIAQILKDGKNGVLAVHGDEDYPYAVPMSYAYSDGEIYLHCAKKGHRIDSINKNPKVSFCVIGQDNIIPEDFNTIFKSVIAFGKAEIVDEKVEKQKILEVIGAKYSPGLDKEAIEYIKEAWNAVAVIKIKVEHITGKAASE